MSIEIHVVCLASQNAGKSHDCCIDASLDIEDIYEKINEMLDQSPMPNAKEWKIGDIESFYDIRFLNENDDIEYIHEVALFLIEHEGVGAGLLNHFTGDLKFAQNAIDYYHEEKFDDKLDFIYRLLEEMNVPDSIFIYIKRQKMWDDLKINDYFSIFADGKYHIFRQF